MKYYRIILGSKNKYVKECLENSYIGVGFLDKVDLNNQNFDKWKDFNKKFIPILIKYDVQKTNVGAGLACVSLWSISNNIKIGDMIISPNGDRTYNVGRITSNYYYVANTDLPHRRNIEWLYNIKRDNMSDKFKNSCSATHTLINITKFYEEIENLINLSSNKIEIFEPISKSIPEPISEPIKPTTIIVPKEREIIYQLTNEELEWKCLTIYKDDDHIDYEISEVKEYTYVFDDNTKLKIGRTSQENPVRRLDAMKTANPTIHIDIVFPATLHKEKFLHDKYDDSRMLDNREWFHKTKSLSTFIDSHKKKNEFAMKWYYKQKEIREIEKQIINW